MGSYVNPGNSRFKRCLNDYIYIDKTELIAHTNDRLGRSSCFLCVSRPRRFGKSMAASMLEAYYSKGCDSKELFAGLAIEKDASFEKHLNRHTVIRFDVQQFLKSPNQSIALTDRIQAAILRELQEEFPVCCNLGNDYDLPMILDKIFSENGNGFVFIIDEWDCVFRAAREQEELQRNYLDFLCSLFKGAAYADLVYMTGILPIKKYGEHSAINMFEEYSMVDPYEFGSYFGFTEAEVKQQCLLYDTDFNAVKQWYDGYLLNDVPIYNPSSVKGALLKKEMKSFWTGTETYEALKIYIERNFDGLREAVAEMLGGGSCVIDTTSFQNDMTTFHSKDDVLTLLVHLGYLTYDKSAGSVRIPNLEVKQEFLRAIKNGNGWNGLLQALEQSAQLLKKTWEMDEDAVASGIEQIHNETASWLKYNDENSLACAVCIAYYSAGACYARPIRELPTGAGLADIVYLPLKTSNRPALVIELKWNHSAEGAIRQIKSRSYTQWIESYTGEILLIGINYDMHTKKHTCRIEKHVKAD